MDYLLFSFKIIGSPAICDDTMNLKDVTLSEISQVIEGQMTHDSTCMRHLE